MEDILFERDLLYSVDNEEEIGVVKVKLLSVKNSDKILAVIEPKSGHDPINYVESLIKSMDVEVFKRAKIDTVKNVEVVINNGEKVVKVVFDNENAFTPFHLVDIDPAEYNL